MGVQFSIQRDKQYPCFCEACLVGKTEDEMSEKDNRYCLGCQQVIEEGYALEAETRGRVSRYNPQKQTEEVAPMEMDTSKGKTKLSTSNQNIATVDNLGARGRASSYKKRPLPNDQIKQLSEQGMGARAIAGKLKREKGITVSYKTIQRILSGERRGI